MWNWDDGHMDDGWGVVIMLGVWAALIAAIVLALLLTVRSPRTPWTGPSPQSGGAAPGMGAVAGGAEQILAERLARGEIDTEEYRTRLDALTSRSQP